MSGVQLYRNCKNFIGGKINILVPDILISQGSKAHEGVISSEPAYKQIARIHDRIHIARVNSHPTL